MSVVTVEVALESRRYPIRIGQGLLAQAGTELRRLTSVKRLVIVTDDTVRALYEQPLAASLRKAGFEVNTLSVPPGEQSKSFARFETLAEEFLALKPDRATWLVALGGGVVGDLTGFLASVALRGLEFVQIPTTLLAQVDSSVGGKTGINSRHGKNLIGSFHQPKLVLIDTDTLTTLPAREMKAGYAEIAKYGLIRDAAFDDWLETHGSALLQGNADRQREAIARSCEWKARIVAADEREAGERALLNFGHTFGHALEAELGYDQRLLHGEAVAIGMGMAAELSARLGACDALVPVRIRRHLEARMIPAMLPEPLRRVSPETLLAHMRGDKKAVHGALTFILLRDIGNAFIARDVPESEVLETIRLFQQG